jgi:ADP-ribose pyrophosphatase
MPIVYQGRVFSVAVDKIRLPNDREVTAEIVRHPRSVVLIPMPDPAHVILVRQYRFAVNRWLWELPAGSVDGGEEPEAAARRECHEEVGLVPRGLIRLGSFFPTPGYCDEEMIVFRLTGLETPETAAPQDEDEDIEVRTLTLGDAREMIRRGEISDMKTLVGLRLI